MLVRVQLVVCFPFRKSSEPTHTKHLYVPPRTSSQPESGKNVHPAEHLLYIIINKIHKDCAQSPCISYPNKKTYFFYIIFPLPSNPNIAPRGFHRCRGRSTRSVAHFPLTRYHARQKRMQVPVVQYQGTNS